MNSDTRQSVWHAEDIPALIAEANAHAAPSEDDNAQQHTDDELPPGWKKIAPDEGKAYYEIV